MSETRLVKISKGLCHILYAYEVGMSLDLAKCLERVARVGGHTALYNPNRRAPKYFAYDPQPLTIVQATDVPSLGSSEILPAVSLTFYDFGSISISYAIPLNGTLEDLLNLSVQIDRSAVLLEDSRQRAHDITRVLGDAVEHPFVAAQVEDYLIFEINDFELPCPADKICDYAGGIISQILRSEDQELSLSEMEDALSHRLSYCPSDISIIDWNSSVIFDKDADDVTAVLEFANTELLELRFLDSQLDGSLDASFAFASSTGRIARLLPGQSARNIRRISQMQLEGAILFERVSNAPKLLGDQFLARIYRLTSQRFHVGEWNSSILRKLDTIENFHKLIHDNAVSNRLELLDWIIIILIFTEIILPFFPHLFPGQHW